MAQMPIDFLLSISEVPMPIHIDDERCVEFVHVLRAARLVEAEISYGIAASTKSSAVITSITHEGRAALGRLRGNKPMA